MDHGPCHRSVRLRKPANAFATRSTSGVATSTSINLRRLVAPRTSETDRRGNASALATALSAESVARPPSAGSTTRTTNAPSYSPPTTVADALGRTWIATRIFPVWSTRTCLPNAGSTAGSGRAHRHGRQTILGCVTTNRDDEPEAVYPAPRRPADPCVRDLRPYPR
jgi:hypothetical protein